MKNDSFEIVKKSLFNHVDTLNQASSFFDWQRDQIDVSSVSPAVFALLNEAEEAMKSDNQTNSDIVRSRFLIFFH